MDEISWAQRAGFSDEYINANQQYLQEVEALEEEFQQHTRANDEINAALEEVEAKWRPIIDEIYECQTQSH